MRSRLPRALVGALMCLPLVAGACGRARPQPSPTLDAGLPALRVLAFYDDRAEKPRGTVLPLIAANRSAIWELAPLWYQVMPDGSVRDISENDVKAFARQNHIKLMPLVINNSGTSNFLLNAGTCSSGPCARAVTQLAAILQRENYDGLNIDFELLKDPARSGLNAFMSRLHARTAAMGKVLTVDIIPAGSRRQAGKAYDFGTLAKNSDDVVLMTYDAHDDTSKPGAIAPIRWVRKRIDVALGLGVPSSKMIVGLADYGYDWTTGGKHATTLGLKDIEPLIARKGITVKRTADGSPHFTYTANGTKHTVWYEDGRSILPKIHLARQTKVKALALWMAGYETPLYWHSLRAAAGTLTTTGGFLGSPTSASVPSAASGVGASTSTSGAGSSSSAAPSGTSTVGGSRTGGRSSASSSSSLMSSSAGSSSSGSRGNAS